MGFKRILVPVDGSHTSARGMAAAIQLAQESGGKLMLLHVVDEFPAFAVPESGAAMGPMLEALRAAGQQTLREITAEARAAGAAPETALVENFGGRVADAVVDRAAAWGADLIVMGTHGRRGVNRVLLGSDAETVARYSPVPVLLVPPLGRGVRPAA